MESFRLKGGLRLNWVLITLFLGGMFFLQYRIQKILTRLDTSFVEPSVENRQMWDPALTRVVSGQFLPIVIDWFWMRALLDPNLSHVQSGEHPQLFYDLDLLTRLDESFISAYIDGGNLLAVIRDDGDGARRILERGRAYMDSEEFESSEVLMKRFAHKEWQLLMVLGYVYLFELEDLPRGSQVFKEAAQKKAAPLFIQRLAQKLKEKEGDYNVLLRLLEFRIQSSEDPRIILKLQKKLQDLKKTYFMHRLNQDYQAYIQTESGASLGKFLKSRNLALDPWGGSLYQEGSEIKTTTEYRRVYRIGENHESPSN